MAYGRSRRYSRTARAAPRRNARARGSTRAPRRRGSTPRDRAVRLVIEHRTAGVSTMSPVIGVTQTPQRRSPF